MKNVIDVSDAANQSMADVRQLYKLSLKERAPGNKQPRSGIGVVANSSHCIFLPSSWLRYLLMPGAHWGNHKRKRSRT